MASVKEKDLPTSIGLTQADFFRIVTSTGASQIAPASEILGEDIILIDKFTTPSHTWGAAGTATAVWWVYSSDFHAPAHAGYTPVGIISQTPNAQSMLIPCMAFNYGTYGDRFVGYIRNDGSASVTDTVTVTILYVKDEHLNII